MNNITALENVYQRVDAMTQTCHDSLIPVKDISFDDLDTIKIAGSSHPLKPIAQRSIAWRLGIPYNYLRKCPPEIQSVQMNYWIEHEKNEQLFARFDRNSVRAIFTPKYKPVDNMDVILEIYGVNRHPKLTHYRRPILTHQWFIGLIPVGPHGGPPGDNIPLGSPPVLHAVAVISGFYDFAMMGQPV